MIDPQAIVEFFNGYRKGRYQIEGIVGRGGMGTVFKAYDTTFRRACAIKILNPDQLDEEQFTKRFDREGLLMDKIRHQTIVHVYDVDQIDDTIPFIIMEWVGGGSLWDYLSQCGEMDSVFAINLFVTLCEALDFVHSKGAVHRDIKPDNILLDEEDHPKITDFGIAGIKRESDETKLTQAGMFMGSTGYMPLEQKLDAESADARADVHALAVTLWVVLRNESPPDVLFSTLIEQKKDKLDRIHPLLAKIIVRATQTNANDRFQSMLELRDALVEAREQIEAEWEVEQNVVREPHYVPAATRIAKVIQPVTKAVSTPRMQERGVVASPVVAQDTSIRLQEEGLGSETQLRREVEAERVASSVRLRRVMIGAVVSVVALAIGIWLGLPSSSNVATPSVAESHAVEDVRVVKEADVSVPMVVMIAQRGEPRGGDLELTARVRREIEVELPVIKPVQVVKTVKVVRGEKQPQGSISATVGKTTVKEESTTVVTPPESVPTTARVKVKFMEGKQVRVWLVPGGYTLPAQVPPGTYQVKAGFTRGEITAISQLNVVAGSSVTVTCNDNYDKCSKR